MRPAPLLVFAVLLAACARPSPSASPSAQQHAPSSPSSPAQPAIDDARVQAIVDAYTTSMSTCPERVWPGHDWDDNAIVLVSKSKHRAWVWSGTKLNADGRVHVDEVDAATLPADLAQFDFFSVSTWHGARALGIDLDETAGGGAVEGGSDDYADLAILLAFHEGFHFLGGQDDFVVDDTSGRDPVLPLDWHPRFLRAEEIAALHHALASSPDVAAALGVAAHWQQRYAADAAADRASLQGLDVIEGTAQYVESVSAVIAKLGCDATDAAIVAEAAAHADQLVADPGFDAGGESYSLGPAAGFLLRLHGQGFEEQAKSKPLQDLLLASIAPADVDETAPDVTAVASAAQQAVTSTNDSVAAEVAPLFSQWDDAGTARLALPAASMVGSYEYEQGFVFGDRADDAHVLLGVQATFATSAGSASLGGVDVVDDGAACGAETFAVPVPSSAKTGDVVTVSAGGVSVDGVTARALTGADGRAWWCVQ